METREIEIQQCALTTETPNDVMAEMECRWKALKEWVKERDAAWTEAKREWIEANGDLDLGGGKRLYLGFPPETVERAVGPVLEELLKLKEGDYTSLGNYLCSHPFKTGSIKKLMEERGCLSEFDVLFETRREPKIKEGSAPAKKSILTFDERFAKK